jgi:hypothetical protein
MVGAPMPPLRDERWLEMASDMELRPGARKERYLVGEIREIGEERKQKEQLYLLLYPQRAKFGDHPQTEGSILKRQRENVYFQISMLK